MTDTGIVMGETRPLTERLFWLWIAIAFVVGLVPGVVGLLWYRSANQSYNATLKAKVAEMAADSAKLKKSNEELQAQVAAAATAPAADSQESTAAVPAAAPGTVAFVSRAVSPTAVSSGAPITLTTILAGKPTAVYMQVKSASVSKIYKLIKASTSGNAVTWQRKDALAPKTKGEYTVFSWAELGGKQFMMDGAGSLTVK